VIAGAGGTAVSGRGGGIGRYGDEVLGRTKQRSPEEFAGAVFRVVRDAGHDAVAAGLAHLEESDGDVLRLVPVNPRACLLTVYPDYPTPDVA
jgi:hypothetical protein